MEKLEGRYSNTFKVGYNAFEIVIDLGQFYVENGENIYHSRIVTGPAYAKEFLKLFSKVIHEYETKFGEICREFNDQEKSKE